MQITQNISLVVPLVVPFLPPLLPPSYLPLFSSHLLSSLPSSLPSSHLPCSPHTFSYSSLCLLVLFFASSRVALHATPSPSSPFPFSFLTFSLLLPHRRILPLVLSLTFCRLSPSDLHLNQHSLKDHSEIFSVEEVARTNITIAIINICFINTHQI